MILRDSAIWKIETIGIRGWLAINNTDCGERWSGEVDGYFNITRVLVASARSRISPKLPRIFPVNNAKSPRGDFSLYYCLYLRDNKVFGLLISCCECVFRSRDISSDVYRYSWFPAEELQPEAQINKVVAEWVVNVSYSNHRHFYYDVAFHVYQSPHI